MEDKSASQLTVLHVDDDRSFLELAATMLEREHDRLTVLSETTAADGLARLYADGNEIDCVLSDYEMPQMDGLEFLVTVRSEFPDVPFVLLTARGSEEVASLAISAGVSDYQQKSGGIDQFALLANRIGTLVSRARMQDRLDAVERELVFWKEFAPAAIVVEPDGTIITASATSSGLFGADQPDALLGRDVRELVHPDERGEIDAVLSRIVEDREEHVCRDRTLVGFGGEQKRTTVQWRTITHWGQDAVLAVMNDFPLESDGVTAPP
ncbi:response regulator [Halorarum halophilum]|uniref:Response regulator n=1 Tax=Halorarum halophilum TaxID=2743090 RepID=A0A7D5K745_9EURY|nr:response regulator [Halobaculum halophilum]QLG27154.1 response regulator [Halobaculum halophilum]